MTPRPPIPLLILCVLVGVVAAGLSLYGEQLAIREAMANPKQNQAWFLCAFMGVAVLGAACAMLTGFRKFGAAPALAMLCAGAPMFVGGLLGEPALSARLMGNVVDALIVQGVPARSFCLPLVYCGVAMFGLAGLTVLVRHPGRSFGFLFRAAIAAIPLSVAGFLLATGRGQSIMGAPRRRRAGWRRWVPTRRPRVRRSA